MVFSHSFGKYAVGAAAIALLAACGQSEHTSETTALVSQETSVCVPVDEANYVFQDGKFRRVKAVAARPAPRPAARPTPARGPWYRPVERRLAGEGFGWMGLNVRGNTVTLTGTVADAAAKTAALEAGEAAIRATEKGKDVTIVDGISIEGGEVAVGAALAGLSDNPTLPDCQKAFTDTMQGRNVQFRIGSDTILPASAALLNAVSAVATSCSAYGIEIGGHTDSVGDNDSNLRLSQRRADSVRSYLSNRGVDVSAVTAKGYGETSPIDSSGTRAGDALNRRTEFTVSER